MPSVRMNARRRVACVDVVRSDHAKVRREIARDLSEVVFVGAKAMQEQQRLAMATLKIHIAQTVGNLDFLPRKAGTLTLQVENKVGQVSSYRHDNTPLTRGLSVTTGDS
jgi:hypothetical protein